MRRRKLPPIPPAPFSTGQRVRFTTRDGQAGEGSISLVGWLPFPGMYSFEVKTDDGRTIRPATLQAIEEQ